MKKHGARVARILAVVMPLFIISVAAFFVVRLPHAGASGFGITPPYVKNGGLARDSHYEQIITLVREDTSEDLDVTVTTNVPGADSWISVAQGGRFTFAKGQAQTPMNVEVNIPKDATIGDYKGNIRVVISPHQGPTAGTVGITLGAQIDVDLGVTDQVLSDFKIHGINVANLEEGTPFWWFYFPGKIRFTMNVENVGNIAGGPSKVELTIYRSGTPQALEIAHNTNNLPQVDPFKVQEVTAEIPTSLPAGGYSAAYAIYKGGEVAQQGLVDINILPHGSIPGYAGYGLDGIGLNNQMLLIGMVLAIIAILAWGVRRIMFLVRRKKKSSRVLAPPPLPPHRR